MAKKTSSTYTPMPDVPENAQERYAMVLRVIAGQTTMASAARALGMSRVRFQTLMHRGLQALATVLAPQPPGRPATPTAERQLREDNDKLRRDNDRMRQRLETMDRLLGVASDMLHGRTSPSRGHKREKTSSPTTTKAPEDEPEIRTEGALVMRSCGVRVALCAAMAGVSPATLRRRATRTRTGGRAHTRRERARAVGADRAACIDQLVRATHGLVGADALRHAVPGVSRRQAAALKRDTLTAMERERIARTERVAVSAPGIVRGFDAMYVWTTGGWRFLLVSGDAAVPFRTSIAVVETYDTAHVTAALAADFARWGAPLVLRLDRAACHRAPAVLALVAAWGVLVLHGAPHHPGFYGQLERQNREHRAWLDMLGTPTPSALAGAATDMRHALNALWKRPTLDFRTAEEVWSERPRDVAGRNDLREEVDHWTARLQAEADAKPLSRVDAERIAIEHALERRGYLSREVGGWC